MIEQHLRADTPTPEASFGIAVKLTGSGSLLVGARHGCETVSGAGAALQFDFLGSGWTQSAIWSAPHPMEGDDFGLALGATQSQILLGARRADPLGGRLDTGCVYPRLFQSTR